MPKPLHPIQTDGRQVALDNELRVLLAVHNFGHLRASELARVGWSGSSAQSASIMVRRTLNRLLDQGALIARPNALGGTSYVLGAKGAARLRAFGEADVVEGYEVSPDGPQFFHRMLGTNYLIYRGLQPGREVFGEYAFLKGRSPVKPEFTRQQFEKMPDGLVLYSGEEEGFVKGVTLVDWVEVESAYKPYARAKEMFELLQKSPSLSEAEYVSLHRMVFVYDVRQGHEERLMRYLVTFLKEAPGLDARGSLDSIVLARCQVSAPLVFRDIEERTALELFEEERYQELREQIRNRLRS